MSGNYLYFHPDHFHLGDNCRLNQTAFRTMMQQITLIPLFGTSFTVFVPMFMLLFAAFTMMNLLPRVLSWLGIETEDPIGGSMFACFEPLYELKRYITDLIACIRAHKRSGSDDLSSHSLSSGDGSSDPPEQPDEHPLVGRNSCDLKLHFLFYYT